MSTLTPKKRIRSGLFPRRTRSWGTGGSSASATASASTTASVSASMEGGAPPRRPSGKPSSVSRSRLPSQPSARASPSPPQPQTQQPKWMDWVTTGVEWLGCDAGTTSPSTSASATSRAANVSAMAGVGLLSALNAPSPSTEDTMAVAQLHEDFLDALLQEQVHSSISPSFSNHHIPPQREDSFNTDASIGSSSISSGGSSFRSQYSSFSSTTRTRKSPRNGRNPTSTNTSLGGGSSLSTGTPASATTYKNSVGASVSAIEEYQRQYSNANANTPPTTPRLPLDPIREKDTLPLPPEFLHADCVLQKDRGKGEPLGSAIKARGKEPCLLKLREKMAVVAQVSRDSKSAWKRRPAIVTKSTAEYIETRSMMELRLGFLSMQYGLLLHWKRPSPQSSDSRPRLVVIVLRKMCHDSFYKVKKSSSHHHSSSHPHHNHHHHHHSHHHRSRAATTNGAAATKPRKVRKQPKLVPVPRSSGTRSSTSSGKTTATTTTTTAANCHDAIWEGTNTNGGAEVLWLEPVGDVPPSTLHVKVANLMMEPSLMAATKSDVDNTTRWSLSLTLDDGPSQILSWTNNDVFNHTNNVNNKNNHSLTKSPLDELSQKTLHWPGLTKPCDLELRLMKQRPNEKLPTIVANRTLPLVEWMSQPHHQATREIQLRMTLASSLQLTLHFTYESEQALIWYQTLEQMHLYDDDDGVDGIPDLDSVSTSSQSSEPESMLDWLCGFCVRDYDALC